MQDLISLLDVKILYPFLLLLARVVSFVAFMPVFGHPNVKPTIRMAFAFILTTFLFPLIHTQTDISKIHFISAMLGEISLGLIASMLFNIVFSAVQIIGDFVGYATSLSMASLFDPLTGSQEGVISKFLVIIATLIFFESGLYELTIVILAKSFSTIHLGTFDIFTYKGIAIAITEIKRMFAFAFAFAFPLFFISFVLDVYYGYGTKSMPSFSPFIVTFQLKFALIFLFILLGMHSFVANFKDYFLSNLG